MYNTDYLQALKERAGMSNKEISDLIGTSDATVSRLLNGQLKDPPYALMRDYVVRLGGSLDEFEGLSDVRPQMVEVSPEQMQDVCGPLNIVNEICSKLLQLTVLHIHTSDMAARTQNRRFEHWLRFSVVLNIMFIVFIIAILVFDALNPAAGWIRRAALVSGLPNLRC